MGGEESLDPAIDLRVAQLEGRGPVGVAAEAHVAHLVGAPLEGEIRLCTNMIIASSLRNPSFFSSTNLLLTWLAKVVGFLGTTSHVSGLGGPGA